MSAATLTTQAARAHGQQQRSRKLNLGCGEFHKPGFLNVDFGARIPPDLVHNLNEFPYPFADDEFELIEADHVLEHLENPFAVMREAHRILSPEGKLVIRVPHFSRGFTHADHKRGFDVTFPYYFNPEFKGGYSGTNFTLEAMRLTWFAQAYLKRTVLSKSVFAIGSTVGKIFDALANASPFLCSRFWCFYVGGFEQIEYHFVCKK